MSYTRSSYKATSSSYRLSSDDDTPSRTSFRSTRSILDSDDSPSSYRRTTRSSLADDLGSTRRTSRGISIDDDSNTISSSVRRSTRLSSRLASGDDDVDSGFTSRRTNRFGSSAGDDEYTSSTRRTTRLSTTGDDDLGISSKRSTRFSTASTGSGDDEFGISSRRLARLSSTGSTGGDDEFGYSSKRSNKKLSSEWSLKEESDLPSSLQRQSSLSSKAEDSSSKYSYRRSQMTVDDDDSASISSYRSTKLSMTYDKDNTGTVRSSKQSSIESSGEKDENVYAAVLDYSPPRSATDEISLKEAQEVIVLSKDKPHKWKVRTKRTKEYPKSEEGYVPSCYLDQTTTTNKSLSIEESTTQEQETIDPKIKETRKKRDGIVKELIETEEDFGRDIQFVANTYFRQLESAITPKELKDVKEVLFGCFKDIVEFHNDVLLKGIQYYAKEPSKIGCTFTQLEREFDKHVRYCRDLPESLKLLENPGPVKTHFDEYSRKIKDDKKLDEHLKLPLQRLNDYQLLLKELVRYTSKLNEETGDLEKALEIVQSIPQRATDLQYISNIEGYKGNLHKLGRLMKPVLRAKDWFDVTDSDGNTNERFVFLFKGRMFVTDVNKEAGPQQRSYNVKQIIKLQDAEFDDQDSETIVINSKESNQSGFPLKLKAKSTEQKDLWLKELKGTNTSTIDDEDEPMIDDLLKEKLESSQAQEKPVVKKLRSEEVKEDKSLGRQTSAAQSSFEDITDTKATENDAKVEVLEDFEAYEEMTAAMTGTLRSESIASVDASHELDTTPSKPIVKKTIKSLSEHEGETATLECEVFGTPTPTVQWLKDNKIISTDEHFVTGSTGHKYYLKIKDINPEDIGLYTVAATNPLGTTSSSAAINVLPGIGVPKVDSRPTSPGGTILPHAPKFKVKLKDTELLDGTTVRFELVVRGMPIPSVTFYKDDKELKEDDRIRVLYESKEVFEIMIDHVTSKDIGVYKCIAVNSEGKDETSGRITVTKDKIVFLGLENDSEPTERLYTGSTSPRSRSPMFKWFKDGKEFEASERFQVQFDDQEDTIALIFQHVKPDDAGLYTCVASTSSGKISCSAELTVQGFVNTLPRDPIPPTITADLADVEVSEGASAMLEAKVTAFPRPKITWYRGEEIIESGGRYKFLYEDEESYTLVIKNCKKEDAGYYRIHAQNDLGEADTKGKLTVTVSPKFRKQMKDQAVMTDEVLKIEVEVEAIPAPEVKWFKDGQQLKEGKRIKLLSSENVFDLVIEKTKLEDAGSYSCVVSNELGQQSGYSVVTVNAPPVFLDKLKSVDAFEEDKVEFTVKINGNPNPKVKFLKNGKLLKEEASKVKIIDEENGTHKLVLNKADSSDAGTYKCVATNDYGEEECDAELTIRKKTMKPNFIKKLQDYEAKEDDEMIEFNVKVEGIPKPTLKWFHESNEIKEKDGYKYVINEASDSYTLVIPKVKANKAGKYTCEAMNSEGTAQTSGILTVNSPPYFIKKLEDLNVGEGEEVKLNVKVAGLPSPKVKWYKDDALINIDGKRIKSYEEESAEFTLIIKNAVKEDAAVYKVVAENVYGKCETSGKLGVSTIPIFTKLLSDMEAVEYESNIELVVKTDSQISKPIIKWFIDEQEIKESDKRYKLVANEKDNTYKLVILSATDELVGRYKCTATNTYGTAETSAKFNVITKPKFIKGLENVECTEGETVSMTVKVKGSPEPDVKFLKDGRDVSAEATIVIKKEVEDIYILEIENIRITMSGDYQCHISNKAGEAFSNGTVVVNSKPKILKDLEDKDSWVNEDVVLEVVVTGNPTPEITWFKDGRKVSGTERILLESREEVFKLKLDKALSDDSGIYKCKAANKSGEIVSKDAKVNIQKPDDSGAPVFVKHITDSLAVVGDAIRFEAKVEGKPEPKVSWTKDGLELKPNDKIQIKNEGDNKHVLVIKDLLLNDAGSIVCKAQNSKGQASDRANLSVQEPESPTIVGLSDIAVVEEASGKLEAKITGIPKPIVTWYKDGEEVDSNLISNEPDNDKYCLIFNKVTEDLTGKYICNASNVAGEAQESAELCISGKKPKFTRELEDSITMSVEKENNKLKIGQNAVFEADVVGIPTPTVTWLKNGKEMVPNDRITINNVEEEYKLEIKAIAKEDVAQYVCKAVNKHGEATSICLLKFQNEEQAPIIKKKLPETILIEEGNPLNLVAKVDGEPMPKIQWAKNGKPIQPSDDVKIESKPDGTVSLTIDNAQLQDSGKYSVKATNPKGEVSSLSEVKVELPQRAPIIQEELPHQIKIDEGKPLNLIAKVEGIPLPQVQWTKDGIPIKPRDGVKIEAKPDGTVALSINKTSQQDSGVYMIKAKNPSGQISSSTVVDVVVPQIAPIIKKKLPENVKIEVGEPLQLSAKVSGEPLPHVEWTKDGVPLKSSDGVKIETKPDGTVSLNIESAKPEDAGKYAIIASNLIGEISSSSNINIISPQNADVITRKLPENVQVIEGEPFNLTAKVDGKPMPEIQWTKDGKPVKPSNDVKIETKPDGTVALSIECAKPQDAGKYALIAKTPSGEVVSSSDVDVYKGDQDEAVIKKKLPDSVDVIEGKTLNLVAKVDGVPIPEVKWTKDGVPIKPSDSVRIESKPDGTVSLSIDCAQPQDAGKYAVIAKTPKGEVISSSDVDVQRGDQKSPAFVKKLPDSVDVIEGFALNLVAKLMGEPISEVKWTKDGVPIKPSKDIKIESKPDGTVSLSIDCAKPQDAGKYAVIAKTPRGEVISSSDVDVQRGDQKLPAFVKKLPDSVDVVEGFALNLAAKLMGEPISEVKWTKDGVPIKPSKDIKIESKPDGTVSLSIDCAKPQDAGKYAVIAKTPRGEVISSSDVDVQRGDQKLPAFVKKLPDSVDVIEGFALNLVAKVMGEPIPEVKWTKDDVPIKPSKDIKIEAKPDGTVSLSIDCAKPQDAGKYAVIAKTPSGEIKSSSDVDVQKGDQKSPAFVKKLPDSVDIVEGKPLNLVAKVEGKPIPEVKWTKDGVPIKPSKDIKIEAKPDGTVSLSIDSAQPQDTGKYAVIAKTPSGEVKSSSDVDVQRGDQKLPAFVKKLPDSVDVVEGFALNLAAKLMGESIPEVKWTKDDVPIKPSKYIKIESKPDGTVSLSIDCAKPQDAGKYAVIAKTPSGEIKSSSDVNVQKASIIGDKLPASVSVVEGTPLNLVAKVDGKPIPEVKWTKDGVPIKPSEDVRIETKPNGIVSLSIDCAQPQDAGKYAFIAKTPSGEVMSSSDVDVEPVILKKLPESVDVTEGKPLNLVAKVGGEPIPEVKWTKDGVPIKPSDSVRIEAKPDGTVSLSIDCAQPQDAGKYAVIAKTPSGEVTSSSDVDVQRGDQKSPAFVKKLPDSVDVVEGTPLNLTAKVGGEPIHEVYWTKDGVPIKPSKGVRIEAKPNGTVSLNIDCAQPQDAGRYAVIAKTPSGEVKSSCDVDVQRGDQKSPAFVKKLPDSVDVVEGTPLNLTAKVGGEPIHEVYWTKDGVPIKPSKGIRIEAKPDGTVSLNIDCAQPQDAGRYAVIAKTPSGEVKSSCDVDVQRGDQKSPAFVKKLPDSVDVVEGTPLNLTAKVGGEPIHEVYWTKDGVPIKPSKGIRIEAKPDGTVSLNIDCAQPQDAGRYAVIAKTPSGEVKSSCDVDVQRGDQKSPAFVKKLPDSVDVVEGTPLILTAKIGGPIPEVTWTKDGFPIKPSKGVKIEAKPDGTVSLMIECASLELDTGKYMISFNTPNGQKSSSSDVKVSPISKKPEFLKHLKKLEVEEGKPCRFECQVSGEPNSICWFKNGEKISPDEHFGFVKESNGIVALLIDAISAQDAGEYRVEIKNSYGEASSSAPLKVLPKPILREKPYFVEELKPTSVTEGNQLTMKAKYKSELPVTVKWMKDGVEIESNDRIKFIQLPDGTVMLQIENANLEDAGKYVVVVTNDEGRTRSNAPASVVAKVLNKPEIIQGLEPTTLTSGEPGKLAVKTSGEPVPDVRFIKDGQQVIPNDRVHIRSLPDGTVELAFDEVKPEDEGKYIAVAVNDLGEARSSAPVTVNRSPTFGKPLAETTGIEGFPAKLETKVEGVPKPELEWIKDGQSLVPDDNHIKAFAGDDGTHALLFDKCTPDDSGTYGVIATNPFGKTEASAPFTVKSKSDESGPECAPIFLEPLQDTCVNEGEPMTFVTKIKANPLPDIKWFLDKKPINASDNIHISFDGTKAQLNITKCNQKHKGLYEVKISNSLGDSTSKAVGDINQKYAPKFIQKLTDTEAGISEPLKLTCIVKGFPEPDIVWYYNGNRIEPGIKYSIFKEGDVCSLVIVRPTDKDSGIYECRARNVCGTDSSKANITFSDHEVKGEAASFLKKLGDCEVREGKTAKFTACVTGSPKPDIKWFKDGVEFEPSSTKYSVEYQRNGMIRFEIRNVEQSDLGEYRCHATNIHGYDNSTAQLTFESLDDKHKRKPGGDLSSEFKKPGIPVPLPDKPRITRMTDDDLTLSWLPSVPIQPREPVTYIVEWCKVPDGEWVAFRTGIRDSQCDFHGLSPGKDYSFRIRVENVFGISDPSPYVTAFRSKLHPPTEPTSRKPKDYDLEHVPLDKQAAAPRFLREEEEIIYGIRGQPVTIEFWVYSHPDPHVDWYFGVEKIQMGGKYDSLQDRNGQICLFITRMTESDVGFYSCQATNEHGEARKRIRLLIAEPPVFTKRFVETTVFSRNHVRLECTVIGVPEPTVKWYKDWQPLHESNRIKILWETPDRATLFINGAITRDAGLYSCTASNIAGNASTSAMLHVEESEIEFDKYTFGYHKVIKPKTKPFEEFYDIGDELGRGTQGIVYHSVERSSGKSFASKMMHGKDKMKEYMMSELDIMNQLGYHPRINRLWDAFTSTPHSLTLITDLCGGGELLECILQKATLTESDVAYYVRQILEGIEYLHFKNIAHFGLTIGDVLVERVNGSDIKIADFGLAQRLIPGIKYYIEFGHPEFVAPEILDKQSATFVSDVWSVGIITYLLLTGISPFLGENDRATLQNLQSGKIDLSNESLTETSEDARDFLSKVLVFDPNRRLDVKAALQHPWLRCADRPGSGYQLSSIDKLKQYQKKWKNWYSNASCKTYYRRRPLHSCFTHPSRMIYPPDERYTPPPSPEREVGRSKFKPSQFDETYQQKISRDPVDAHSESQYQSGPDTYLLQLRDTDFATRIRQYLRVGASRSPSLAASLRESHWGDANIGYGYAPQVAVRERRKFTDVMDEEIGEERRGLDSRPKPRRLLREIGTSGLAYGQLHQMKKEAIDNVGKAKPKPPFFREKLKDIVIKENEDVVFSCYAVGEPSPSYTWFRNDGILIESSRIEVKRTTSGRCELRIKPARAYDAGHYKCVARNAEGAVVCRARLKMGDTPGLPEPPEIKDGSNREIYLCWSPPKHDGNSHIVCYKLEYQKTDESNWTLVANNIMHEFYVVRDLEPENCYHFRVTARNKFGWGEHSSLSEKAKTQSSSEATRIKLPKARIYRQIVTEDSGEVTIDDIPLIPDIDYSKELNPIPLIIEEHNNLYDFVSEISRGRFSLISKTFVKETEETLVCKAVLTQSELESGIYNEYEVMKSLAHERIANLHYASRGSSIYALVMERLSGIDVLTFLSQRQKYSEEIVSKIIHQVLDAIEYLHFRGICLLELQPDNVVMIDQRKHDIKLCDFANARRVPIAGTKVSINGTPEYISPELIKNEEVTQSTDIWCVGVLTYILLSGVSPFRGSNDSETAQNVVYVRYLFDHLYPEITQEAIRFILTVFKLTPHKRPTIEECADHKWILPNEFMIKKRESAMFSSHKLAEFADEFHSAKSCSMPARLASVAGIPLTNHSSISD